MADFPSLVPAPAYGLTAGTWASSIHVGLNAGETRIRHADAELGRRLALSFPAVTRAQMLLIVDHYRAQSSDFLPFAFNAATLPAGRTPTGYAWLYAGPPRVIDRHTDCFDVTCEFIAEPRGLVAIGARSWRTPRTTLLPGRLTDGRLGNKAWISAQGRLNPGRIGGIATRGFITGSSTLTPGGLSSATVINGKAWVSSAYDSYLAAGWLE